MVITGGWSIFVVPKLLETTKKNEVQLKFWLLEAFPFFLVLPEEWPESFPVGLQPQWPHALQVQAAMRSKLKYESAAEAPLFFCQADDSPHSPIISP